LRDLRFQRLNAFAHLDILLGIVDLTPRQQKQIHGVNQKHGEGDRLSTGLHADDLGVDFMSNTLLVIGILHRDPGFFPLAGLRMLCRIFGPAARISGAEDEVE